ncbi:MAG: methyltransferase [Lentimicrobiaceae bacterium]|nr:methyltransferase [Lentimicrobiaceae bacterium]MCB9023531.1 methyltransferase [Lentimicrobiaceae bacterium]
MAFRFKQFTIDDSACPMKVGTDSVLLGSWADFSQSTEILDIGTGSGLLALMAAQQSQSNITAIEIDESSVKTAVCNFQTSPWPHKFSTFHISLQDFCRQAIPGSFNHIITNPPYFINSLKSPEPTRSHARHNDLLSFEALAFCASLLLAKGGLLSMVLPVKEAAIFLAQAEVHHLHLNRRLDIIPREGKPANRILFEFGKNQQQPLQAQQLSIRHQSGEYTDEYKSLTAAFYLHF